MVSEAGFSKAVSVVDQTEFAGVQLTRTGGKHGPEELLSVLGEVSGFVLQKAGWPTLYLVGNCLWDVEIEGYLEHFRLDIVVTNSGGARFMGGHLILMDEEATRKVAEKVPSATVLAVHLESIDHCQVTRNGLREMAVNQGLSILAPDNGEKVIL